MAEFPKAIKHHHVEKIRHLIAIGKMVTADMKDVVVEHEGNCGYFAAPPGYCNCDPKIMIVRTLAGPEA